VSEEPQDTAADSAPTDPASADPASADPAEGDGGAAARGTGEAASAADDPGPETAAPARADPYDTTPPGGTVADRASSPPPSRRPTTRRLESPTQRMARGDFAAALQAPFLRPILRFPLRRAAIWGAILVALFFARRFFGVIFLTFVISYISTTLVNRIMRWIPSRKAAVLLVYLAVLGAVTGIGFATVPRAIKQGKDQLDRLSKVENPQKVLDAKLKEFLDETPVLKEWGLSERLRDKEVNSQVIEFLATSKDTIGDWLRLLWESIWGGVLNVGLALIFSFMIVWDMERISAGMRDIQHSRLSAVWAEVAPSIATFFRLLGRAFEAQTAIAIVNTALTCIGMLVLGIDGIGFLALIVFVCSFVPIVGVFVSTVPICLVGLQNDGGIGAVIGVVVMVTVIHLIEAYVLNPRIYGYHMKLHPVVVLVVLYLAQELFGVWGLIIAVPLATYVWRHLILGQAESVDGSTDDLQPSPPDAAALAS
jgi:predicted PurR-regulated permease PerM